MTSSQISVFDLFSVGIGPSSSHTVGPMRAATTFVTRLAADGVLDRVRGVQVDLYGSLAATGHGHGTLTAVAAGLVGHRPETITSVELEQTIADIQLSGQLPVGGRSMVPFTLHDNIALHPRTVLPRHTNGVRFTAYAADGSTLADRTFYSVGGGFVVAEDETVDPDAEPSTPVPYPFSSAAELLQQCRAAQVPVSGVMLANELVSRSASEIRAGLLHIHAVMEECAANSLTREGTLPGPFHVRRRAKHWYDDLRAEDPDRNPVYAIDWANLIALAVNEENASGGRVVTAPTNGAAGIVPAVLHYALNYIPWLRSGGQSGRDDAVVAYLLTAGAIGALYKHRASISGAEVGCQGEVGSAASMAAGALAELLGGTPEQVENAAEIAMEHNLGLTCDPIGGLVQIPCIERNAIASAKAINAARMALRGDGAHHVSLDQVIETMRQTGADMSDKYKETSEGGLAVNVPLC
jgi:L-serine dehydratase